MTPLERIAHIAATHRRPNRHELAALATIVRLLPQSRGDIASALGVTPQRLSSWLRLADDGTLARADAGNWPPTEAQLGIAVGLLRGHVASATAALAALDS